MLSRKDSQMILLRKAGAVALIAAAAAWTVRAALPDPAATVLREIASPAGPGSAQPRLTVLHERSVRLKADSTRIVPDSTRIVLSWLESADRKTYKFSFAERTADGWTAPRTIVESGNLFVNWADVPAVLALNDGRLAAHWLERNGNGKYAYGVRVALSSPDRRTWSRPVTPHADTTATEHGFVSWWGGAAGKSGATAGLIWLDGRDFAQFQGGPHGEHEMKAEMALRAATMSGDGTTGGETVIDSRVCDCCPTAAVRTSRGVLVAYRDRSPDEVRDIALARYTAGRWTKPYYAHRDNWRIPGCPVNGPALAADGDRVVLAWFTVPDGSARVLAAFSTDGGATFGKPIRVDDGVPIGRLDAALGDDGSAAVSWIEHNDGKPEFRVRRITSAGPGTALAVSRISGERSSGYPRIAFAAGDLYAAWTDVSAPSRVKVAVLTGFARTGSPRRPTSTR